MKGYILFKNGKSKYCEFKKKVKYKNGEIKAILVECWHPVFGLFYISQKLETFKKTMKYASKSTVQYRFLDGILVDDDDAPNLFVKNKYWFNDASQLFSKIMEIIISERIFNDSFWIFDSFFQFIYDSDKVKLKGSKKKKTMKVESFCDKYMCRKLLFKENELIKIDSDTWKTVSIKKAKGEVFFQLYKNVYFKVDSKLLDIGKYDAYSYIYLTEENFNLNTRHMWGKTNNSADVSVLLEMYVARYIIPKLESYEEGNTYRVENKVRFKNKKLNKKYKFGKFIRKYFVDIEKY